MSFLSQCFSEPMRLQVSQVQDTSPCDQPCSNQVLHWPIAMINLWFTRWVHIFRVPVTSLTINMKCEQLKPTSWNKAVPPLQSTALDLVAEHGPSRMKGLLQCTEAGCCRITYIYK